ncbi:putative leucine-rich repeat receptor-like serine/threonine-protein kinase At2g19230 isoform X3 [Syzygium oleosum]|uniref:putative leucine-rich repeat receptor-like serine/threonine-protein kinase At2g19230 isoform X3 n=1 Tax=Syzygium oleosum TaxID=219896 RepID=UPI0024BB7532|nr:putative leucine-rich repeat receptor-like serine/threonine-protein kinase At2g19230 isoform X3 [Syzygium oleosum]
MISTNCVHAYLPYTSLLDNLKLLDDNGKITCSFLVCFACFFSFSTRPCGSSPKKCSIDCGAPNQYTEEEINITYETDERFIDFGENMQVSSEVIYTYNQQYSKNLRSFPNGTRNCYTLRPDRGTNITYLIRATFWYGNYDGKNQTPSFDLHIGVNYWATVNSPTYFCEEIMYVSQADDIQVCLVNTGKGVPFISALELRPLDNDIYRLGSGFLPLSWRYDIGLSSKSFIRYPDDVYDRIWYAQNYTVWFILNTTSAIDLSVDNDVYKYNVPGEVLRTAQRSTNASSPMKLHWPSISTKKWIVYFYFMEIERLTSGQQREFTISMNDNQFTRTVSLKYLEPVVVVSTPVSGWNITFSIESTNKSGNPPILNAVEFYTIGDLPNVPTAQDDVKAINDIKAMYHIKRESWQGDPCVPSNCTWDGLTCSSENPPRIILVKLSSSNLTGEIVSSFSHLSAMEYLDLSNNQLTGAIPETLSELQNLRYLNLSGNNLIGSVPEALKKRVLDNTLIMSLTGNTNLCGADRCLRKKKQKNILVPVVASVSGFFVVLFGALAIVWLIKRKRIAGSSESMLRLKNRPFKYGEVSRITGNFRRVIGEGGFGKVYLGTLENGTVVAVKMLSKSSKQGYKEFQAEVQLLMIVHHGNLVSLFGYCDDSRHMALIYEYMANGNLRQHLSGKVKMQPPEDHLKVLTWSKRLQIAVDVAQGLDYLHNGCKPPIIHRDLKTTNILLNEDFRAKIADFGLSRAFATENDSYVSTCPAGTPGYLDPEFQSSGNLNKKSDVYSFGIILFELITGQPATMRSRDGSTSMHILQWLIPIVESGDIQRIMDPRLQGEFDINLAWKVVKIAMSCTRPMAIQRPDINQILAELKESLVSESSGSSEMVSLELRSDSAPLARLSVSAFQCNNQYH